MDIDIDDNFFFRLYIFGVFFFVCFDSRCILWLDFLLCFGYDFGIFLDFGYFFFVGFLDFLVFLFCLKIIII